MQPQPRASSRNPLRTLALTAALSSLFLLSALIAIPAGAAETTVANVTAEGSSLIFDQAMEYESVQLSVRGPKRTFTEDIYASGKSFAWDVFDNEGRARPDGTYTFELRATPFVDREAKALLAKARLEGNEDEVFVQLCEEGRVMEVQPTQNGYFQVIKGGIVMTDETEEKAAGQEETERTVRGELASGIETSPDKQVISGNLTVYNSLCVGFDCLASESYGADTIRLKENNLRIHFDDTSTAGSYPRTDWRLEANSNVNGGGSYFAIQDATAVRNVFVVEASAPSSSLYVDNGGRVGVRTSNPVVDLHISDGDTPTLRLEQTGASGFAPQTWDVAGNETSFFVRDASNGSTLPFRIFPSSASNTLVVKEDNVGIGTTSPNEDLHIRRTAVPIGVKLENSTDGRNWNFKLSGSGFAISEDAEASTLLLRDNGELRVGNNGAEEFVVDPNGNTSIDGNLDVDGNITATGTISDRNRKQQIVPVDGAGVLDKVLALPVSTWVYNHQTEIRHIGPMAQDFHQAFGLGTEESIGLTDLGGLSLAAIQELNSRFESQLESNEQQLRAELAAKDAELEQLRSQSAEMQQRMEALEAALLALQQR